MKAVIASIAALGLIASPALAATKAPPKASTSTAKEAKAEGESVKTEAKEHKAAAHHRATCSCPKKSYHKTSKKTAAKSTKSTKSTTKKPG